MKTKTLSYSFSRKISDGNYGSLNFSHFEEIELEPTDDVQNEYTNLRQRVIGRVMSEAILSQGVAV